MPANLDQVLNTRVLERLRAGARLRAADSASMARAIESALNDDALAAGARAGARLIAEADAGPDTIERWLVRLLAPPERSDRN
jgi:UDP:flavonoid glycosyltransferase YjiC (YdhE family)